MGGECPALGAAEERGEGGLGVDGEGPEKAIRGG
jgi:hypothetical protein